MRSVRANRLSRGFTLIELMIVIVVIGILVGFVLTAATAGVRRAEERATQSLITKLEAGMNDRIEAITTMRASPTAIHKLLASIYDNSSGNIIGVTDPLAGAARAQVIAQYDMFRAELPDVFYVPVSGDVDYDANYPINFAAHSFPLANSIPGGYQAALPMGAPIDPTGLPTIPIQGMNGASFTAAAGLYKNAGYAPKGYDGLDNNGNGFIDEAAEGGSLTIGNHTHNTARAEMLYALLVEGQGPLGSVFNADDFTLKEVRDTDKDGLPEFVDAWGQPLQFFRWPIYHHSNVQKGAYVPVDTGGFAPYVPPNGISPGPYASASEIREQDPLDPNQQLVAPRWWSSLNGNPSLNYFPFDGSPPLNTTLSLGISGSGNLSAGAVAFEHYFHKLTDPNWSTSATQGTLWDRGSPSASPNFTQRRAYYTKFLIVSSGPDQELGLYLYPDASLNVANLMDESQALPNTFYSTTGATPDAYADDISNHNLNAAGGSIQ